MELKVIIGASITKLQAGIAKAKSAIGRLGVGIKSAFSSAGMKTGLLAVMGLLSYKGLEAAKAFWKLNKAMAQVNTIARVSKRDLQDLTNVVDRLSMKYGQAADEIAEGMYQAFSARVPRNNIVEFMETATQAAVAGKTDVKTSVDALTTVLNSYSLSAEHAAWASDVMFAAVVKGKTTYPELADNLAKVTPLAAQMGFTFEQVAAAFATMTMQGARTDVASTQLRATINSMVKPTKEMKQAIKNIEKGMKGAKFSSLSLQGALKALYDEVNGDTEALGKLFPRVRGLTGVLQIMSQEGKTAAEDLSDMNNVLGQMKEAMDEVSKSKAFDAEKLAQEIAKGKREIGSWVDFLIKEAVRTGSIWDRLGAGIRDTFKRGTKESVDNFLEGGKVQEEYITDLLDQKKTASSKRRLQIEYEIAFLQSNGVKKYLKWLEQVEKARARTLEIERKIVEKENSKKKEDSKLLTSYDEHRKEMAKQQAIVDKTVKSLDTKIKYQKLINEGKKKEVFILKEIEKLKKQTGELDPKEEANIRKKAGALFDLSKKEKQSTYKRTEDPIITNELRRIGGNAAGKTVENMQKKQLDVSEKMKDRLESIDSKTPYPTKKSNAGVFR